MSPTWTHLIRFIAKEDGQIHLGQIDPVSTPDAGLATFEKKEVKAKLIEGSIYDGVVTENVMTVGQVRTCGTLGSVFAHHELNFQTAALPNCHIRRTTYKMSWFELSRSCKRSEYAHSGVSSLVCKTPHGVEWTISPKDYNSKVCARRIC
jgi:hypothetical protein